ncbi:hypothetical protein HDZ31DRAFT_61317 [Schizophyllum fasciatum]
MGRRKISNIEHYMRGTVHPNAGKRRVVNGRGRWPKAAATADDAPVHLGKPELEAVSSRKRAREAEEASECVPDGGKENESEASAVRRGHPASKKIKTGLAPQDAPAYSALTWMPPAPMAAYPASMSTSRRALNPAPTAARMVMSAPMLTTWTPALTSPALADPKPALAKPTLAAAAAPGSQSMAATSMPTVQSSPPVDLFVIPDALKPKIPVLFPEIFDPVLYAKLAVLYRAGLLPASERAGSQYVQASSGGSDGGRPRLSLE